MKANRILLLCGAVALPQLAMAELPSPQGLGMVHAILTYCAQVDPQDAKYFQQEWNSIVGGASAQQLGSAEGSAGYQQETAMVNSLLDQTSKETSANNCAVGAAQWRGPEAPPSSRERDHREGGNERHNSSSKQSVEATNNVAPKAVQVTDHDADDAAPKAVQVTDHDADDAPARARRR